MKVEINEILQEQNTTFTSGNSTIMITPTLGEDYYLFRVHLYKDQYLLAFPKFSTLGIGFAQEEDWNCNLPYTCDSEKIYNHIKHNKKYKKEIKKKDVIKAITLLQVACEIYMFCKKDKRGE